MTYIHTYIHTYRRGLRSFQNTWRSTLFYIDWLEWAVSLLDCCVFAWMRVLNISSQSSCLSLMHSCLNITLIHLVHHQPTYSYIHSTHVSISSNNLIHTHTYPHTGITRRRCHHSNAAPSTRTAGWALGRWVYHMSIYVYLYLCCMSIYMLFYTNKNTNTTSTLTLTHNFPLYDSFWCSWAWVDRRRIKWQGGVVQPTRVLHLREIGL